MNSDAIELYDKGNALYQLGKYPEAIDAYKKAVHLDRTYALAWCALGVAYYELKEYQKAIDAYDKAINTGLNDKKVNFDKGNALYQLGKYPEAIDAYKKAVHLDRTYASARCNMGVAHYKLKEYPEAIDAYDEAIKLFDESPSKETDPKYISLLFNRGNALYQLGKYQEAIDAYNQSSAWCNMGVAHYKLKEYPEAIDAYDKAINTGKEVALSWCNKGIALYQLGKYPEAIDAYKKAVHLDRTYALAWCALGVAYYELKEYQKAIDAYDEAIKIDKEAIKTDKDNASVDSLFGEIYLGLGDLKSASEKAESALGKERCASALMLQGRIEIENKRYDNAIKLFEEAIGLNPVDAWPLLWKVYARYLKSEFSSSTEQKNGKYFGEIDAIIRELERLNYRLSKKEEEEKPYVLYLLGCCYYKRKDAFTAKEKLQECLEKCKLWSDPQIKRPARRLLVFIWDYAIRPTWWQWWLTSPFYRWQKRTVFCLLCLFIFALLLLYPFIPMPMRMPFYEVNHALYGGFILLLLVLLVSPSISIKSIKVKDIKIELQSSPPVGLGFSSVGLTLSPKKMQTELS